MKRSAGDNALNLPSPALPEGRPDGEFFRLLAESNRDMVWAMDFSLRIIYISPAVRDFLGWTEEEYAALPPEAILVPDSLAMARRAHAALYAEAAAGQVRGNKAWRSYEALHKRRDGRLVWGEVSFSLLLDPSGVPRGFHGTTRDIGERQFYEKALRDREDKYRRLIELIPIGVFECDMEGRLLFVNDALFKMTGHSKNSPPELVISRLVVASDLPRIRSDMARMAAGGLPLPAEYSALRADGSAFPIEVRAIPLFVDGQAAGFRGVIIDIGDRKRYEAELLKANRLEAVGILAGGIAHDFNNLLAAVLGNVSLARIEADERPERTKRFLGEAEKAILRARGLTQQLLTFSKGGSPVRARTDLATLVREVALFNARDLRDSVEFDIESDLPPAFIDADQVAQVVQNLVINAMQAGPEGAKVRVGLRRGGPEEAVGPSGESWLVIEVADEGPGIPPEIRDRIFEPWFTTKDLGSGLGLAICFSVAKNHGGSIHVTDAPGGGALFRVFLPASPEGTEDNQVAGGRGKPLAGRRILLVEDDEMLRELLHNLCAQAGYLASSAGSAGAAWSAWEKARSKGESFDLVIADMRLDGGTGGMELIDRIMDRDENAKILLSSGYSEDQALSSWRGLGFAGLLKKPYDYETFVSAVESALTSARPSTDDR